nr:conopeptide [Conus arenatus]
MNMSMTLSGFVMVVTAATVIGSTPQEPDLSRMERDNRECCIEKTYQCLQGHPGEEHTYATSCHWDAANPCGVNPSKGCCTGYMHCMGIYVQENGLEPTHNYCKDRNCERPGR